MLAYMCVGMHVLVFIGRFVYVTQHALVHTADGFVGVRGAEKENDKLMSISTVK